MNNWNNLAYRFVSIPEGDEYVNHSEECLSLFLDQIRDSIFFKPKTMTINDSSKTKYRVKSIFFQLTRVIMDVDTPFILDIPSYMDLKPEEIPITEIINGIKDIIKQNPFIEYYFSAQVQLENFKSSDKILPVRWSNTSKEDVDWLSGTWIYNEDMDQITNIAARGIFLPTIQPVSVREVRCVEEDSPLEREQIILNFGENFQVCTTYSFLDEYRKSQTLVDSRFFMLPPIVENHKNCYDLFEFEEKNANSHLFRFIDSILIYGENKTLPVCFKRSELGKAVNDLNTTFFECTEETGYLPSEEDPAPDTHRLVYKDYRNETPEFARIGTHQGQFTILYNDVRKASRDEYVEYDLQKVRDITLPISTKAAAMGLPNSRVSSSHCQDGSQVAIYRLIPRKLNWLGRMSISSLQIINKYLFEYHCKEFKFVKVGQNNGLDSFVCAPILPNGKAPENIIRLAKLDYLNFNHIEESVLSTENIVLSLDKIFTSNMLKSNSEMDTQFDFYLFTIKLMKEFDIVKIAKMTRFGLFEIAISEKYRLFIPKYISKIYLMGEIWNWIILFRFMLNEAIPNIDIESINEDNILKITSTFNKVNNRIRSIIIPSLVRLEEVNSIIQVAYTTTDDLIEAIKKLTPGQNIYDICPYMIKYIVMSYSFGCKLELYLKFDKLIYEEEDANLFLKKYKSVVLNVPVEQVQDKEFKRLQMIELLHMWELFNKLGQTYRLLDLDAISIMKLFEIIRDNEDFAIHYSYFVDHHREEMFKKQLKVFKYNLMKEVMEIWPKYDSTEFKKMSPEERSRIDTRFIDTRKHLLQDYQRKIDRYLSTTNPVLIIKAGIEGIQKQITKGMSSIELSRLRVVDQNATALVYKSYYQTLKTLNDIIGYIYLPKEDSLKETEAKYKREMERRAQEEAGSDTEEMEITIDEVTDRDKLVYSATFSQKLSFSKYFDNLVEENVRGIRGVALSTFPMLLRMLAHYNDSYDFTNIRRFFIDNDMGWYFVGELDHSTEEENFCQTMSNQFKELAVEAFRQEDGVDPFWSNFGQLLVNVAINIYPHFERYATQRGIVQTIYSNSERIARSIDQEIPNVAGIKMITYLVNNFKLDLIMDYSRKYRASTGNPDYILNPAIENEERAIQFYEDYEQRFE